MDVDGDDEEGFGAGREEEDVVVYGTDARAAMKGIGAVVREGHDAIVAERERRNAAPGEGGGGDLFTGELDAADVAPGGGGAAAALAAKAAAAGAGGNVPLHQTEESRLVSLLMRKSSVLAAY